MSCPADLHVVHLLLCYRIIRCHCVKALVSSIGDISFSFIKNTMQSEACNCLVCMNSTPEWTMDPHNPTGCNTDSDLVSYTRTLEFMRITCRGEGCWFFDAKICTINGNENLITCQRLVLSTLKSDLKALKRQLRAKGSGDGFSSKPLSYHLPH